jgi:hypothetical protein
MPGSENEISLAVWLFPAQRLDPNTDEYSFLPFACASNGRPFSGRKMTAIWWVTPSIMRLICRQTAVRFRR